MSLHRRTDSDNQIWKKVKIAKIQNYKENSKRKVLYQIAKSKAKTDQTNKTQLSYN